MAFIRLINGNTIIASADGSPLIDETSVLSQHPCIATGSYEVVDGEPEDTSNRIIYLPPDSEEG